MKIQLDQNIYLESIEKSHAAPIFQAVDQNRIFLREWLSFVDKMQTLQFAENFVVNLLHKSRAGLEVGWAIMENEILIGRIGIHKIDQQNRIGEIGYWLVETAQGKGVMTKACKLMLDLGFTDLKLNRIEIKCGVGNFKSAAIPKKLNFKNEGILKEAEFINDKFIDLYLFSLLASEHHRE